MTLTQERLFYSILGTKARWTQKEIKFLVSDIMNGYRTII